MVAFLVGGNYCSLSIRCFCGNRRREKRKGRERNERNCRCVSIESLFPSPAPSPKISSPFTPKAGLILRLKGRARKFILTREVLKCLEEVSLRKHPFLLATERHKFHTNDANQCLHSKSRSQQQQQQQQQQVYFKLNIAYKACTRN